jgi:hypothetical protein
MEEIKYRYMYQHEETGRVTSRIYNIEQIENGFTVCGGDLAGYFVFVRNLFCGRMDKKGNRIFENDLIRERSGNEIILVKWVNNGFMPFYSRGNTFKKQTNWENVIHGEIIGNIYENEELIKEGNQC